MTAPAVFTRFDTPANSMRFPRFLLLFAVATALCCRVPVASAADSIGGWDGVRDEATGNRVKLTLHDNGNGTKSPQFYVGGLTIGAALPAGTNLIGKVGIDQTTPGTTNGVQVNAALPAGTNIIGKVGIDQTTNGTTNKVYAVDGGAGWTTVFGVSGARFTSADQSGGVASVSDAPTSGQKLVITDIKISVDTAMKVTFREETSGTVVDEVYMTANSTVNLITRGKFKLATANKKLQVQTSAAGNISVNAFYYSEP